MEFPCSQAHNLLTRDQQDAKDNFSPKKKYDSLTHFDATAPLKTTSNIPILFSLNFTKMKMIMKKVRTNLNFNERNAIKL